MITSTLSYTWLKRDNTIYLWSKASCIQKQHDGKHDVKPLAFSVKVHHSQGKQALVRSRIEIVSIIVRLPQPKLPNKLLCKSANENLSCNNRFPTNHLSMLAACYRSNKFVIIFLLLLFFFTVTLKCYWSICKEFA